MAERPTVQARPTAIPVGWIEIYRQFRTALLGRVIDDGFVDEKIRPLFRGIQVVGTAITVRLEDGDLEPIVPAVDLLHGPDPLQRRRVAHAPAEILPQHRQPEPRVEDILFPAAGA